MNDFLIFHKDATSLSTLLRFHSFFSHSHRHF